MNTKPKQNTYQYYKDVHQRMINNYIQDNHQEEANALKLQSFLTEIKALGRKDSPKNGLSNAIAIEVWNRATKLAKKTRRINNTLLNEKGGANLEKDLTNIILATMPKAIVKEIDKKMINIGSKQVNLGAEYSENIFNNIVSLDSDIPKIMQDIRPDLQTYAKKNSNNEIKLRGISGKTDVAGPGYFITDIVFEAEESGLEEYYNLLKDATFTAKNYASQSSIGSILTSQGKYESLKRDLNADFPNLHLGNSDPYRAIFSSLQFLGYPKEVIQSAFFAGYWRLRYKNEESDEIGTHLWHLRFAYELTGAGSFYLDTALSRLNGGTKYLIYNDPASIEIFVCSTRSLISNILKQGKYTGNPLSDAIVISKQHVKNISRA